VLLTLQNMRQYLTGLTANLAKHTITDVQHEDRVSLLLKDSFIESFAPKERPFVRQFVVGCCDAIAKVVHSDPERHALHWTLPRCCNSGAPPSCRRRRCSPSLWCVVVAYLCAMARRSFNSYACSMRTHQLAC
jgi:hypothetical protein